ncbi:uncharacterized protein ANIA_11350 [Aspergillus nidulans FGSC A4]|uniref:Uncharacterized protein n=1 Tax=Emericella nidulans (strain FGSC A4 / ATCC 38163 / CBS 112.46 / NRRL 194 / M139) TaxID=227321 RepID=C8VPW3_EMENI|nr:hypothetical protein [Aspergillus nidulans FGSC A4]CBF87129.1 TPA: hypothetical protein ANIA_11350 [Aspergillus nidulans FGSC A4]
MSMELQQLMIAAGDSQIRCSVSVQPRTARGYPAEQTTFQPGRPLRQSGRA